MKNEWSKPSHYPDLLGIPLGGVSKSWKNEGDGAMGVVYKAADTRDSLDRITTDFTATA